MKNEKSKSFIKPVIAIGIALLLSNIDASIVIIAMPTFSRYFNAGPQEVSWIILVYLLAMTSLSPLFGRLGDMKGVEKVFQGGYILFTVSSFLCAFSPGLALLVFFRFIQGVGGAMVISTYCAMVALYVPEEKRGRAFGFLSLIAGIGFALGAPAGGYILKHLNWQWIFMVNIPFGIAGTYLCYRLSGGSKQENKETTGGFDLAGAALSFISLASLAYALNCGPEEGWSSPAILILMVLSIVSLILFIVHEKRTDSPLFDLTLLKKSSLTLALLAALAVFITQDGFLYLFPFYFETAKSLTTDKAGDLIMIFPAVTIIFSPLAGYLTDRKNPRIIAFCGLAAAVLSCIMFSYFTVATGLTYIIVSLFCLGFSLALFFTSNITYVMSYAEPEKEGMLSAFVALIGNLGALMGISLFQAVYSQSMKITESHMPAPERVAIGFSNSAYFGTFLCIVAFILFKFVKPKRADATDESKLQEAEHQ